MDGLRGGTHVHTEETHLPTVTATDSILIGDGSKSGYAIRGAAGVLGSTLVGFRAHGETDPSFLHHQLTSLFPYLSATVSGSAVPHLDAELLDRLVISTPEKDEQAAIARILDAADTAIERARVAVENAERVRTSLLQASFTFGKWPESELKDSRVGRIPHAWDAVKGKAAFEIITGGNSSVGALRFSATQLPDAWFMKVDDFNLPANRYMITCSQIGFSKSINPSFMTVPVGTVIIAKRGAAILKNRVRVTAAPVAIDPNLMAIGPKPDFSGRFLRYQLEWRNLSRYVESSGVPQINNKDLYPRWFLKAPEGDQKRIVSILEAAETTIEAQRTRFAALERLKRGLMQDLLTGRVRVKPPAAAPFPAA